MIHVASPSHSCIAAQCESTLIWVACLDGMEHDSVCVKRRAALLALTYHYASTLHWHKFMHPMPCHHSPVHALHPPLCPTCLCPTPGSSMNAAPSHLMYQPLRPSLLGPAHNLSQLVQWPAWTHVAAYAMCFYPYCRHLLACMHADCIFMASA